MDPLKQMGTKELICIDELTGSAHGVHVAGDSDELYRAEELCSRYAGESCKCSY